MTVFKSDTKKFVKMVKVGNTTYFTIIIDKGKKR